MIRKEKMKNKIIDEIKGVIEPKIFNFKNKTIIGKMEKEILFEALGFLNLINYSSMPIEDIKKHWDKSNLAFM